jgi:DNA-binding MarR family transcriptional regulator
MAGGKEKRPASGIDRLVHEPSRFLIMAHLYAVKSADFVFLVRQTGMTWGNISAHLSKLESAGYISIEKEFVDKKPRTLLGLTPEGRAAFDSYRKNMKRVLDDLPGDR